MDAEPTPETDPNYDEAGKLTPHGLAEWMDQEGGVLGLYLRNGPEPFLDAGCDPRTVYAFGDAHQALTANLTKIGADL